MTKLIKRDVLRLADGIESLDLWHEEKEKPGTVFPGSTYEPDERISFYTAKRDKYRNRVLKHLDIAPDLVEIVINILKPLFKDSVIQKIIELIF